MYGLCLFPGRGKDHRRGFNLHVQSIFPSAPLGNVCTGQDNVVDARFKRGVELSICLPKPDVVFIISFVERRPLFQCKFQSTSRLITPRIA